ncbi:MAG: redox-sensing transcriptional repressor [Candidatus Marinimicrobia bacterium]|jgi:redox-sensing transcriptional repressor|nr:redox-sensing transcriptional repressor [Candidatus Neomarinimicrobiota bacterium]
MRKIRKFSAPEPSMRRLPTYLHVLTRLLRENRLYVSCTFIANELYLDPTQVRKDLALTGIVGKPRVGYSVQELIDKIKAFLGWDVQRDAILVGVGNLGTALLGYQRFRLYGLNIVTAFDKDPRRIDKTIFGVDVLSVEKLPNLILRKKIDIGIITVGEEAAQEVADLMVQGFIKGIWNFAPKTLIVPDDVIVENVQLSVSLGVLTSKMKLFETEKDTV